MSQFWKRPDRRCVLMLPMMLASCGGGGKSESPAPVQPGVGGSLSLGGVGAGAMPGATGGTPSVVTEACVATEVKAGDEVKISSADIIFAVDSSGSMRQEIQFVQDYMNEFSRQIVASGVDARVILIGDEKAICIGAPLGSGQCPGDSRLPSYVHVPRRVDSNDGLNVLIDSYPDWRPHLRAESFKHFVIVSDDDATTAPHDSAGSFAKSLNALDPGMFMRWAFHGVYCFSQCPDAAAPGQVYDELVALTTGVRGDLCDQDFQPVFDRVAEQIVRTVGGGIACSWPLPAPPVGESFTAAAMHVQRTNAQGTAALSSVNSAEDCQQGGVYLDDLLNPTRLVACPSTCEELQGQTDGGVTVSFDCQRLVPCSAGSTVALELEACRAELPAVATLTDARLRYTSPSGFVTELPWQSSSDGCREAPDGWYIDRSQLVVCGGCESFLAGQLALSSECDSVVPR